MLPGTHIYVKLKQNFQEIVLVIMGIYSAIFCFIFLKKLADCGTLN